jgi:tripartite-type tricarboxylate transporter receptor subunit TctC
MLRVAALVLLATPLIALGQTYPSKPIRVVVPYAAGGALDAVSRAMAQKMSESTGQPVIVDNRPGASGIVGSEITARAAPDGYTVLAQIIAHNMVTFFNKGVPFDPVKDFTPVGLMAVAPAVLVVNATLPVQSVRDLVDYAKKNPGKLDYGTTGIGTMQHLGGLMLAQTTGIKIEHVPYKGGAPAVSDLISGQILMAFLTASTAMPHVKSGKLRALGVIERRRFATVPGVPAIGESVKDYGVPDSWLGVLAPAGVPAPIVARLNAEMRKAMAAPDVIARLEGMGFEVATSTPEEFSARIAKDMEIIRHIVTTAGIKPE